MTSDFHHAVQFYKLGLYKYIVFNDKVTGEVFRFHPKQIQAIKLLNDNITSYVGYGGAARGGKSALIAADAILTSYAYPECALLIGRKNLTILWETTWRTLLRMLTNFGFKEGIDYKYDGQKHILTFENGSTILAKNLELKPSDTEASDFGSLEILKAYIDQSEHVAIKIIEKVGERAGSHFTTTEYSLKGKVFEAFNPSSSHTKRRYWVPFKTKTEKKTRKFVRALPSDNPGREAKDWVEQKEKDFLDGTMTKTEYQKQILGNFDYDDNPDRLCDYDSIIAMFSNTHISKLEDHYLTADIARLGSDWARIGVWKGLELVEVVSFPKSRTTDIQTAINTLRQKYNIPAHRCIADEDGVGGGVVDNCAIKGFVNNATPLSEDTGGDNKPQYQNLQTQCLYKLAKTINSHLIHISTDLTQQEKDEIIEECEQIQSWKTEDDRKLRCKPKKNIKEDIGRSPDWRDMLLMRMFFEINNDELVFEENTIKTYSEIPTETKDGKEVKQGNLFSFIIAPEKSTEYFTMGILRVIGSMVYLEDVIFDSKELSIQVTQINDKLNLTNVKRIVYERSRDENFLKDKLPQSIEIYGQYSKSNKMQRVAGFSGTIKEHFLLPENPNEPTKLFIDQLYRLIKTSKEGYEAASLLSCSAAHLEAHYGLFK